MQLRRARLRRRCLRVDHRRQRLVVDVDQLERVVGLIRRLGDDHGDDVADVADDVAARRTDTAPILRSALGSSHAHGIGLQTPSMSAPV